MSEFEDNSKNVLGKELGHKTTGIGHPGGREIAVRFLMGLVLNFSNRRVSSKRKEKKVPCNTGLVFIKEG